MAELLLAGAPPESSFLIRAADRGNAEFVRLLLHHASVHDKEQMLLYASRKGFALLASVFIGCGFNLNVRDTEGRTPLILATRGGSLETAQTLLDAGVSVNDGIASGMTPLMYAASKGYEEITSVLLEYGGNTEMCTKSGMTPYGFVVKAGIGTEACWIC